MLELEDDSSLAEVLARAEQELPEVAAYRGRLAISLNEERCGLEARVSDGDEVALLPPMSGGAGRPWVQSAPLSMDALLAEVTGPRHGGVVTFTGVVRDHSRGHAIDHLEYEAYVPMAEKELRAIVAEAADRWPDARVAVVHRIGRLEIGDVAVLVAAASPHRGEAFDACRYTIDTLKKRVPIWKKEFADEGTYWVEENP